MKSVTNQEYNCIIIVPGLPLDWIIIDGVKLISLEYAGRD
jgi:hypothetical protein